MSCFPKHRSAPIPGCISKAPKIASESSKSSERSKSLKQKSETFRGGASPGGQEAILLVRIYEVYLEAS